MNAPRKYANNQTGISISQGQGQINITKICWEVLGKPRVITFVKFPEDSDWMYMFPRSADYPNSTVGIVQFWDKEHMANTYIGTRTTVDDICRMFKIYRKDPMVFSPFYMIRETMVDGEKVVCVCMNNFDKYRNTGRIYANY